MKLREMVQWNKGRSVFWQVLLLLVVLLYVAGLHWSNDGLWYQGDSPRHAANGLFWWDFLASFPVNPIKFALSYYACYPVINPATYPPVFYLIEGVAFKIFGASPFVAKGLVLAFALFAGLYATAWLRRWVSEEAGWGSALLVLQPGIISWSNSITLNIPSMALMLAAMYHARRWIEAPKSRQIYLTAFFALLGILTYYTTGIVVFVTLAWIIAEGRWGVLWDRRVLILCLLSALLLVPFAAVLFRWDARHAVTAVYPAPQYRLVLHNWTYYLKAVKFLFSIPLLVFGGIAIVSGLCDQRWRREVKLQLIWVIVCYVGFSYLLTKEERYILVLGPPLVILCVIGLISFLRLFAAWLKRDLPWVFLAAIALLSGIHIVTAPFVHVPQVKGFKEMVAFFEEVAPEERVLYDGTHNGVFSFYMRARDPDFKRGVVLGNKLLYTSSMSLDRHLSERVSSSADVIRVLQKEGGCRWLAIEWRDGSDRFVSMRALREAVTGPEFQFVKSFPVIAHQTKRVDVYRFLLPVEQPNDQELPFPRLGKGKVFRSKPIERTPDGFIY